MFKALLLSFFGKPSKINFVFFCFFKMSDVLSRKTALWQNVLDFLTGHCRGRDQHACLSDCLIAKVDGHG